KRDYLLDDANGNGAINPSRVLDDRPERERAGLQASDDGAVEVAGDGLEFRAAETASLENILSPDRYSALQTTASAALSEVHHDRTMVLGRSGRSGRRFSGPLKEV